MTNAESEELRLVGPVSPCRVRGVRRCAVHTAAGIYIYIWPQHVYFTERDNVLLLYWLSQRTLSGRTMSYLSARRSTRSGWQRCLPSLAGGGGMHRRQRRRQENQENQENQAKQHQLRLSQHRQKWSSLTRHHRQCLWWRRQEPRCQLRRGAECCISGWPWICSSAASAYHHQHYTTLRRL